MSKFVKTTYGSSKEILKINEFEAISVIVSDEGITAIDGKKIVPAGTIIAGKTKSALQNPDEPVVKKNTTDAEGVLLTDVDVTHGPGSGSMVVHGFIDLTKLPEAPTAAAITALNMIKFMK